MGGIYIYIPSLYIHIYIYIYTYKVYAQRCYIVENTIALHLKSYLEIINSLSYICLFYILFTERPKYWTADVSGRCCSCCSSWAPAVVVPPQPLRHLHPLLRRQSWSCCTCRLRSVDVDAWRKLTVGWSAGGGRGACLSWSWVGLFERREREKEREWKRMKKRERERERERRSLRKRH